MIKLYSSEFKSYIIEALMELQCYERSLSSTRKVSSYKLCESYLQDLISKVKANKGKIFMFFSDQIFNGFICYFMENENTICEVKSSNKYCTISDLCILEKFRGRGIAGKLIDAVFDDLVTKKYKGRIRICTLANNDLALKAYKKYGFKPYEIIYEKSLK